MLAHQTILIVDDEPLILEMFQIFLEQEGYSVLRAASSEEALWHLKRSHFDFFLCDVMLGGPLDGFDLVRIIREQRPSVGAILVTGHPKAEDQVRAERAHCRYLAKPIGFDLLKKTLIELRNERTQTQPTARVA